MKFDQNSIEAAKKVTELMGKPLGEIAMEILDLEAQVNSLVNSLSDILAEKDHKIIDLEADKERLTRSWQDELRMNGKIRKELREYKTKCAAQEAAIRCKDGMIIELANKREKHA